MYISYPISIDLISYNKRQGIATQYYYAANMHIQPITGADVLQSGVFKCNIQSDCSDFVYALSHTNSYSNSKIQFH